MERVPKKSPSDIEDSNRFTLLCNPQSVRTDKKTDLQRFSLHRHVPPVDSLSEVITPKKLHLFQMDLFSPKKEDEPPAAKTPRQKRRASESHTSLTPGISELLPSKAKRSRVSTESTSEGSKRSLMISPMKALTQADDIEMNASHVFANSPGSPSSECKAMMDEIDVSPVCEKDGEHDFLKRQTKYNLRRCHSLELRKKLIDMTNTPPCAFKKSLFKKPLLSTTAEVDSPVPKETSSANSDDDIDTGGLLKEANEETCESADHVRIKQAVDVLQTQGLIADGSRQYCLPLITGKQSDLKNIDPETMALLVSNRYPKVFDKLTVIDCRYPYEYNGGHIRGSINLYTKEAMTEFLDNEIKEHTDKPQTHILVFHCEFSSQRGPSLLRHLRNCDRQINSHQYPQLAFPEIYCLFGGYKEFFADHPDLCEPSAYTTMLDEKYASDLRHFRAKAKSWTAGDRVRMKLL